MWEWEACPGPCIIWEHTKMEQGPSGGRSMLCRCEGSMWNCVRGWWSALFLPIWLKPGDQAHTPPSPPFLSDTQRQPLLAHPHG